MQLYTPVEADDAARLERGEPVGSALTWVDRPVVDEAEDTSIWMVIEIPESEAAESERPMDAALGYREFVLPEAVVLGRRASRANVA
jgi:uncharacterized membrane-anchored protein